MSIKSDSQSILRLYGRIRRQLNLMATGSLRPLGLGPKQAVLLREVHASGPTSPADLARLTHTDPASTGKIIDSLIKKGWVKRTEDPNDRRRYQLSLTEKGAKLERKLDAVFRDLAEALCEPLSAAERSKLSESLTQISNHLEQSVRAKA